MSFPVAVQSAIFYIVACTPCAKARHRQKAREVAKRERMEKAKLETEQPGLYRHPSPFNTNPYWQEEIDMGPSLPKKSISKNSSQRGLTSSSDRESTTPSMSERATSDEIRPNIGDSISITRVEEEEPLPNDWNWKKGYQREDEELWGQWSGTKIKDAISKARDSAGRLIESTLGSKEVSDQERRDFYTTPRNPPVNDFHPPVVSSKHPDKDAHRWMLQPPPSAKIMEGKVPVSRAASSGSKSSGMTLVGDDLNRSRTFSEKKKLGPTESELIDSLFITRSNQTIPRARSMSFDGSDDTMDDPFDRRRRSRIKPMAVPPGWNVDDDSEEDITAPPMAKTRSHTATTNLAVQRPKLETIPSSDASSTRELSKKSKRSRSKRTKLNATSPVGDDTD